MRPAVQDREAPTVTGTYSDCAVETTNVNPTVKSLNPFDERTVRFCGTLVHQWWCPLSLGIRSVNEP